MEPSTLLRIAIGEARVGMFVHALDGSWLDNPFWTRSFTLASKGDVARLQRSPVRSLLIDLAKGLGPSGAVAVTDEGGSRRVAVPTPIARPRLASAETRELRRAAAILHETTRELRSLFEGVSSGRGLDLAVTRDVVSDLEAAVRERPRALLTVTRLKTKDEYSYRHSVAVCALVTHFGRHLGLDASLVRNLGLAGLLHDIGKVAIPSALLGKPGKLSDDEMALMQTHPQAGYDLLRDEADLPEVVREMCLHHHERIDGRGYPAGLSGEAISMPVRILSICDVFDAVTSIRPYKDAWSSETALARMSQWHGQFDPVLLLRFFQGIGVGSTGMGVGARIDHTAQAQLVGISHV
ncbi:HD-GYP domain-containing protein [Aureimonas jatrophae]|uniref:HDIG domain-containing protein n=1 Tax=Aureimonas jatrophae TaxID=1166073 RepID=A0A1H0MYH4_9HYPH|nr:HD-GYP domain-containing protein [Aureimonas jatrophae]MBB3953005.1 putative nucleotidyltransferase with HDIG domain [Aureimonas jatrophae]SDO85447.1 HDIG domain-containing protein [Aureimonas jatrophae]